MMILVVLVSVYISLTCAINSYQAPPCYDNIGECRLELGHKAIDTLQNKYLLMIGDSLTRYQYLSLVYTLRHRHPPDETMYPDMNEFTHKDWQPFFETTNSMLAPYEHCDCSYYDGRFFENRRYYDPRMNISVTYLMFRGFFLEGSNDTNSLHAQNPKSVSAPKWSMGVKTYLLEHFQPKKVDYVVTNVGQFEFHESVNPHEYISWCQALSDKVIWKTTTAAQYETIDRPIPQRARMNGVDTDMCGTKHVHCMDTSWTVKVDSTKHFYDSVHFREPVYAILNDQLMDMLKHVPSSTASSGEEKRLLRKQYTNSLP